MQKETRGHRDSSQKILLDSRDIWGQGFTGHGSCVALSQVTSLSVSSDLIRQIRGKHVTDTRGLHHLWDPAQDENGGGGEGSLFSGD